MEETSSLGARGPVGKPTYRINGGEEIQIMEETEDKTTPVTSYSKANRKNMNKTGKMDLLKRIEAKQQQPFHAMRLSKNDPENLTNTHLISKPLLENKWNVLKFDLLDVFTIIRPEDTAFLKSDNNHDCGKLKLDTGGEPITYDLFINYLQVSVTQVAASSRYYAGFFFPLIKSLIKLRPNQDLPDDKAVSNLIKIFGATSIDEFNILFDDLEKQRYLASIHTGLNPIYPEMARQRGNMAITSNHIPWDEVLQKVPGKSSFLANGSSAPAAPTSDPASWTGTGQAPNWEPGTCCNCGVPTERLSSPKDPQRNQANYQSAPPTLGMRTLGITVDGFPMQPLSMDSPIMMCLHHSGSNASTFGTGTTTITAEGKPKLTPILTRHQRRFSCTIPWYSSARWPLSNSDANGAIDNQNLPKYPKLGEDYFDMKAMKLMHSSINYRRVGIVALPSEEKYSPDIDITTKREFRDLLVHILCSTNKKVAEKEFLPFLHQHCHLPPDTGPFASLDKIFMDKSVDNIVTNYHIPDEVTTSEGKYEQIEENGFTDIYTHHSNGRYSYYAVEKMDYPRGEN
eukprot:jgi/Psemu1/31578/gm1.31578_g